MGKAHFGLIGLGVMGENLVLNAERNGYSSVVYNRTYAKTEEFLAGRGAGKDIVGAATLQDFVGALERPRRILMMVKAGQPVDDTIDAISPFMPIRIVGWRSWNAKASATSAWVYPAEPKGPWKGQA